MSPTPTKQQIGIIKIQYSSPQAKMVALVGYLLSAIPVASFIGLFFVQDTLLKIILGIFVAIALLRIFWNAHHFKNLEFHGKELLLKLGR